MTDLKTQRVATLADCLAANLQQPAPSATTDCLKILQDIFDPGLRRWYPRARLHDNGFLKVVVVDQHEWSNSQFAGCKLVMHIWDNTTETGRYENVHNHRWPFWSMLLCGQLVWEHYSISQSNSSLATHFEYEYESPEREKVYRLVPKQPAALDLRMRATVTSGTCLTMTDSELHRVQRSGDATAATLILQGRKSKPTTNVYVRMPHANPVAHYRHAPPERSVRQAPREMLSHLVLRVLRS